MFREGWGKWGFHDNVKIRRIGTEGKKGLVGLLGALGGGLDLAAAVQAPGGARHHLRWQPGWDGWTRVDSRRVKATDGGTKLAAIDCVD